MCVYIYEQEIGVLMCCLTNFRILLILSHVYEYMRMLSPQ